MQQINLIPPDEKKRIDLELGLSINKRRKAKFEIHLSKKVEFIFSNKTWPQ